MKKILGLRTHSRPQTDFSLFFHEASSREKKKVIVEAVRRANADQRAVVEAGRTLVMR